MSLTKSTASFRKSDVERVWYIVDLEGQILGRAAARIASVLRGKHKPTFTPHDDVGDFVVVINAGKVELTGNKMTRKIYRRHTNYPGGLKETKAAKMLAEKPEVAVHRAIRGMLPKGPLGRRQLRKLKIYAGEAHPHAAQNPQPLAL